MATNIGKFPRNPTDGDQVSDVYGNRWQYTAESDAWISKGVVIAPAVVTENNNGIIDSDIYSRLSKLDAYLKTGVDIRPLKLYPGVDAYWYYFRSSDKLFRFSPEGESALRVEVDRGRLFQILMKQICPGARGANGPKGDKGRDGVPGAPEVCYYPSEIQQTRLDFAIHTPTPILPGGPIEYPNRHVPEISVRLYKISEETVEESKAVDQMQHMAIVYNKFHPEVLPSFQHTRDLLLKRALGEKYSESLCDIPLSKVAIITGGAVVESSPSVTIEVSPVDPTDITIISDLDVDEAATKASIQYDLTTNIICGSVFLNGFNWADVSNDWCVKSRQKGPDGLTGDPGECYLRIVECTIDDTNVTVSCPIINARLDCDLDIIYTICADLLEELCVDKISLLPNSNTLSDATTLKSVFASAQMTLEECKYVNRYEVELESDESPELELVHWDPQPGCVTQRHYAKHEFRWIPSTDVEACSDGAVWYGLDASRPGIYPWDLIIGGEPEEDECCEDSWFWCPNVQDPPLDCASPEVSASLRSQDVHRRTKRPSIGTGALSMGNKKWNMII